MLMQFGEFIFKENPAKLHLKRNRKLTLINISETVELVQNRGRMARVAEGEGVFLGQNALEEFKKLTTMFDSNEEAKMLVLPHKEMFWAYFSKLLLVGSGMDWAKYTFEFVEDCLKGGDLQ
ncbi:MAG: hypothetical protein LBJ38_01305 [Oscillospiraceae bacterium]|jgi:hypothetical protein|nr:hypothetical protein [Oscillospiraceae bacterium]